MENNKVEVNDISFVMIDGNNIPANHIIFNGGKPLGTDHSNRSFNHRGGNSLSNNPEYSGIPLPSELKVKHEILMLIAGGETNAAITMLRASKSNIASVRGLNL